MKKHIITLFLLLTLSLFAAPTVLAADETSTTVPPTKIYTIHDLQAISADPDGSYILMEDLDMSGVDWKPIDFCGSFDGNGHAILNLTLSQPGDATADAYDGNCIPYSPEYVALFSTLRDASVSNLQLINVRAVVETDRPCFLAGIAGYMESSVISNCTVTGCLELRAHDRIFGVGGVAGYGGGSIENCQIDVTLICTDTDSTTRDEQFMGGVYATGFIDVLNCQVNIHGYCSEYGYVHNGGIVGMYMQFPMGSNTKGQIIGNTVTGAITFFECNSNRRAYCAAYSGETLGWYYSISDNQEDFSRNEVWTYDTELRPETCESPNYTQTVVAPGCDTFGYTIYSCNGCGYSYTDHYTLPQHTVTLWTVTTEPTTEAEGVETGYCDGCNLEFTRTVEKLPEPEVTQPDIGDLLAKWMPAVIVIVVAGVSALVLAHRKKQ